MSKDMKDPFPLGRRSLQLTQEIWLAIDALKRTRAGNMCRNSLFAEAAFEKLQHEHDKVRTHD